MNIAVSVSQASGSKFKPNKHGKLPMILSALNGTLPVNSGIIDTTIAERMGLIPGCQAVVNITFRDYYESNGQRYPNYNYVLVTKLSAGFEQMVAERVVASMDFGFSTGATPTPTPVQEVVERVEPVEPVEPETEE